MTAKYPYQLIGDGLELSQDPILRQMQLRREAERLERKAACAPDVYGEAAKEAREDYERFIENAGPGLCDHAETTPRCSNCDGAGCPDCSYAAPPACVRCGLVLE